LSPTFVPGRSAAIEFVDLDAGALQRVHPVMHPSRCVAGFAFSGIQLAGCSRSAPMRLARRTLKIVVPKTGVHRNSTRKSHNRSSIP
jgi:hypothetical protein